MEGLTGGISAQNAAANAPPDSAEPQNAQTSAQSQAAHSSSAQAAQTSKTAQTAAQAQAAPNAAQFPNVMVSVLERHERISNRVRGNVK